MFNVGDVIKCVYPTLNGIIQIGTECVVTGTDTLDPGLDNTVSTLDGRLVDYWIESSKFELVTANPFAPNHIPDAFYSLNSKKEKTKMKKVKSELERDTVESETLHVGIELELKLPCDDPDGGHDDDSCSDHFRERLDEQTTRSLLSDEVGLTSSEARQLEEFFDRDAWIDNRVSEHSCDDSDCPFKSETDGDSARSCLENDLVELTGNKSFKVVEDGSINTSSSETDAEVCWNYFASKDTVKDNAKILKHLSDAGCNFDKSCGLHINLNNYLKVPKIEIEVGELAFLFNFVAPSRKESSFCNKRGMSSGEKYSMIYHQEDRLEFRFFSPTLEADKLNHYVQLANTVYKRLAGKDVKLSKKTCNYFYNKMTAVNGLTKERAIDTLNKVNSLLPAESFKVNNAKDESTSDPASLTVSSIDIINRTVTLSQLEAFGVDVAEINHEEMLNGLTNAMYQVTGISNPETDAA